MVVVAVHSMLADASSYTSLVISLPVEVMRLSVGQSSDALLAGGCSSVVCHFYKLKVAKSECEERRRKLQAT
jgi:hypothetical protein